jgi:hypothetical protein
MKMGAGQACVKKVGGGGKQQQEGGGRTTYLPDEREEG